MRQENQRQHYKKLEQMYLSAPLQIHYPGINIDIQEGKARIELPVQENYFHAARAVHGSIYFRLLDDAAFFAVNSVVPDQFVLTSSFNIYLLRPVTQGILTAHGSIKFSTRSSFVGESELYDHKNRLVATGSGTFVKSKMPLSEDLGYR